MKIFYDSIPDGKKFIWNAKCSKCVLFSGHSSEIPFRLSIFLTEIEELISLEISSHIVFYSANVHPELGKGGEASWKGGILTKGTEERQIEGGECRRGSRLFHPYWRCDPRLSLASRKHFTVAALILLRRNIH